MDWTSTEAEYGTVRLNHDKHRHQHIQNLDYVAQNI